MRSPEASLVSDLAFAGKGDAIVRGSAGQPQHDELSRGGRSSSQTHARTLSLMLHLHFDLELSAPWRRVLEMRWFDHQS
jgi:hypothetical protein